MDLTMLFFFEYVPSPPLHVERELRRDVGRRRGRRSS